MGFLKKKLKAWLKDSKKVAVLGIGSPILGDDALGIFFIKELKKRFRETLGFSSRRFIEVKKRLPLKLFSCETVPENYTGEIKKFNPTHIIIVDAAEMGKGAGEVCILDKKDKFVEASFSTHRPHRKALNEYLRRSLNCRIISICIQVKTVKFGAPLSREVEKTVKQVVDIISDLVSVKE